MRVLIEDANKYICTNCKKKKFDLVIFDVTDFGCSESIFEERTMHRLQHMLRERSIVIFNFNFIDYNHAKSMVNTIRGSNLEKVFKHVLLYSSFVPSNGGAYCFAFM